MVSKIRANTLTPWKLSSTLSYRLTIAVPCCLVALLPCCLVALLPCARQSGLCSFLMDGPMSTAPPEPTNHSIDIASSASESGRTCQSMSFIVCDQGGKKSGVQSSRVRNEGVTTPSLRCAQQGALRPGLEDRLSHRTACTVACHLKSFSGLPLRFVAQSWQETLMKSGLTGQRRLAWIERSCRAGYNRIGCS